MKAKKNTVKTYCYGQLHEFATVRQAMAFYYNGMCSCEGSEHDRYFEIYRKLKHNAAPFCDCDGVPEDSASEEPKAVTDEDRKHFQEIIQIRKDKGLILDTLRRTLNILQEQFKKENAALFEEIEKTAKEFNDLSLEMIRYEKLGLRA